MKKKRRIIWAIDPFENNPKMQSRVLDLLDPLAEATQAEVEPVFVLSPSQAHFDPFEPLSDLGHTFEMAQKNLRTWKRPVRFSSLLEPKIMVSKSRSLSGDVDALWKYAAKSGAEMIVTATHARKGLSRWFLGSFTETLLLRSKVPVMTVPPHAESKDSIRTILFPTDLGEESDALFPRIIELARRFSARLVLFHAAPRATHSELRDGVYSMAAVQGKRSSRAPHSEQLKCQEKLTLYRRQAEKKGIVVFEELSMESRSISEQIFSAEKKWKTDLIAMPAQSGWIKAPLVGSLTRMVVRGASCPVWILHRKT